jgi:hypothetical protein
MIRIFYNAAILTLMVAALWLTITYGVAEDRREFVVSIKASEQSSIEIGQIQTGMTHHDADVWASQLNEFFKKQGVTWRATAETQTEVRAK